MMILQEQIEAGFLGSPPVVLSTSFMHSLIPKNVFKKMMFNEADNEVACLTQAERHYFIYCMFNAIRVDADVLFSIFVSIPSLSVEQIRDLHNLFYNKERTLKNSLFQALLLPIEEASSFFKTEFEEMQRIKEVRAELLHLLKVEYEEVVFTQASHSFVKRTNQSIQIPDDVFNAELKKIDFTIPQIMEISLFKKGISMEDKQFLWRLVLSELSMDGEGKVEFLLSLSSMTRREVKQWIKKFFWSAQDFERSVFNLLVGNEFSIALKKFEEFYRHYQKIEGYLVSVPAELESRLHINKEP